MHAGTKTQKLGRARSRTAQEQIHTGTDPETHKTDGMDAQTDPGIVMSSRARLHDLRRALVRAKLQTSHRAVDKQSSQLVCYFNSNP